MTPIPPERGTSKREGGGLFQLGFPRLMLKGFHFSPSLARTFSVCPIHYSPGSRRQRFGPPKLGLSGSMYNTFSFVSNKCVISPCFSLFSPSFSRCSGLFLPMLTTSDLLNMLAEPEMCCSQRFLRLTLHLLPVSLSICAYRSASFILA